MFIKNKIIEDFLIQVGICMYLLKEQKEYGFMDVALSFENLNWPSDASTLKSKHNVIGASFLFNYGYELKSFFPHSIQN